MPEYYIGLMSGTSLDGIDAVLVDFDSPSGKLIHTYYQPYPSDLRARILALNSPMQNEVHEAALVGNELAKYYAGAVTKLLAEVNLQAKSIIAIGCHGQTIRHCPASGYTIQLGNGALLSELTDISVVSDFRSRDIAAGGQGAPLVPAFHQAIFSAKHARAILNIGGIANVTYLPTNGKVIGFDSGPGNILLDAWSQKCTGKLVDSAGIWAASGSVLPDLLINFLRDDYFKLRPPKSTGRDTFNLGWIEKHLTGNEASADVQATLLKLIVRSIADAINTYCPDTREIFVCGGGAHNSFLLKQLRLELPNLSIDVTDKLGIGVDWIEAFAFAWLAKRAIDHQPGNLPSVTGAKAERILGAIYPA